MLGLNVKQENSSPIVSFFLKRKSLGIYSGIFAAFQKEREQQRYLIPEIADLGL